METKNTAPRTALPPSYAPASVEPGLAEKWENDGLYRYDPARGREETFVVDTPPPTVSGALHIGHVFSYVQTDILARYQRMRGKNIFYPMGWDDNGLPTERRVQNLFGIKCDPAVPYVPGWKPEKCAETPKVFVNVSRNNFLEACALQTAEDEKKYEALWRRIGLSVDWTQQYSTVGPHCRRISQYSFLDLFKKGFAYNTEAPTLWDTSFQTAVAQAEVEDRESAGFFYDIRFRVEGGGEFVIATTRPELLAACVAVVAHPDDARFKPLFGKYAVTPLFGVKVPIMPAEHADPEKGTGIMMVCTFGDIADVEFWKKNKLPLRQVIGKNGRLAQISFGAGAFESSDPAAANAVYAQLAGLYAKQAKAKTAKLLAEAGFMAGEPRPTAQAVKFYEKGDLPLEFVPARQWFLRILDKKEALLTQGRKVDWHPPFMLKRYEQWVEGLNQDWCISRQRYFGVPFPLWYPLDAEGKADFDKPILADPGRLPVDPQSDCPAGYSPEQRGKPGGFIGDPDVMDTWATSSLTPQVSSHWPLDADRHAKLFPADLRPQAHEIIRTWAFYTITKSWMHAGAVPWKHIAVSGWVVSPDKGKMSKSKGKTVSPEALLETYSADALRYWAGRAKLGQDTVYDESVFKVGMRIATKIFNAAKFVMLQTTEAPGERTGYRAADITHPLDTAWICRMRALIDASDRNFAEFDYAALLLDLESCFWDFCDNYLELVKTRAYEGSPEAKRSARAALEWTMGAFLRLFAPFMPFITEEVWSWHYAALSGAASVHKAAWPAAAEAPAVPAGELLVYTAARKVMEAIRTEKAAQKKSVKCPVASVKVECRPEDLAALEKAREDILAAGCVAPAGFSVSLGENPGADGMIIKVALAA